MGPHRIGFSGCSVPKVGAFLTLSVVGIPACVKCVGFVGMFSVKVVDNLLFG